MLHLQAPHFGELYIRMAVYGNVLITHHLPIEQVEESIKMLGTEGVLKVVIEP